MAAAARRGNSACVKQGSSGAMGMVSTSAEAVVLEHKNHLEEVGILMPLVRDLVKKAQHSSALTLLYTLRKTVNKD